MPDTPAGRAARGRPPGRDFEVAKTLRFAPQDAELLRALSNLWGCSEAAAVRRLIREEAARSLRSGPLTEKEPGCEVKEAV